MHRLEAMRRLGLYSMLVTIVSVAIIAMTGYNAAGLLGDGGEQLSPLRNFLGLLFSVIGGLGLLGLTMAAVGGLLRLFDGHHMPGRT